MMIYEKQARAQYLLDSALAECEITFTDWMNLTRFIESSSWSGLRYSRAYTRVNNEHLRVTS